MELVKELDKIRPKDLVSQSFDDWMKGIRADCKKKDWDIVIIVSGSERIGKSTFTYHASKLFENKKGGYDWQDHFILSPDFRLVVDKLKKFVKKSVVVDEAIKVLYKFKMWDDLQILLNQIYTVNGQNNNLTFLNIPRQTDLNKFFRDGRAYYWVQILDRGVATIFVKDEDQFNSDDVWHVKEAKKIIKKFSKGRLWNFLPMNVKVWIHSKIMNYVTTVYYDDIPEPDRTVYKDAKKAQEFEGMQLENRFSRNTAKVHRDILIKEMLTNAINKSTDKKYTQTQIANVLNVNQSRITRWLSSRRKINASMGIEE